MTFQKGQSGNPAGRRPGTGHVARLRATLAKDIPEILTALVEAAKQGDTPSAKLILERVLPPLRPEARPLPANAPTDPREVPGAVVAGILTQEQGAALLDIAAKLVSIEEMVNLAERLEKLEALVNHEPG